MEEFYPVSLDGKKVGNAYVSREGLYYRIRCKCKLPEGKPWRIRVCGIDLGVCCQMGQERGLQTRIPVKSIGFQMEFTVYLPEKQNFYPINEKEPFPRTEQLMSMCFVVRDGKPGLQIKDPASNQPGSDRSP